MPNTPNSLMPFFDCPVAKFGTWLRQLKLTCGNTCINSSLASAWGLIKSLNVFDPGPGSWATCAICRTFGETGHSSPNRPPQDCRHIDQTRQSRMDLGQKKAINRVRCKLAYTLHPGPGTNLTTYDVKPVAGADLQSPMYQATLVTVLSDKVYVGKLATDAPAAKRSVAQVFLTAPEVQALFDKIPPKLSDIKSKVRLDEMERKRCKEHNASRAVRHEIEFRRADAVLAVFREIGYRIDLWDQLDELGPRSHRSGIVRAASPREKRF